MEIFHNLWIGFQVAVHPINVMYCFIGVILGDGAAAPLEESDQVAANLEISLARALTIFCQGVQQSIKGLLR